MSISSTALLRRFITKAKFRHMEVLLRVAELGSMRRAAEAVGMTQPSISQLISEFEALMETQLFFRHARGVEPTDAARELLPVARRILGSLGEGAEIVANRLEENAGLVRAAASEAGMLGLVHPIVPEFGRRNKNIHLTITLATGADPLALIAEDAVDILGVRRPEVIPKGWEFETCQEDALVTVCGTNHPLAKAKQVSLDQLGEAQWLMNRVDSIARRSFEEMAAKHDWPTANRCNIVMHVPELTQAMLATGDYLAIVPRSVARPYVRRGDIVELECDMSFPLAPLGFVWEGEKAHRAVSIFAGYLRKSAEYS